MHTYIDTYTYTYTCIYIYACQYLFDEWVLAEWLAHLPHKWVTRKVSWVRNWDPIHEAAHHCHIYSYIHIHIQAIYIIYIYIYWHVITHACPNFKVDLDPSKLQCRAWVSNYIRLFVRLYLTIRVSNSSPSGQNGCHFADDVFGCLFLVPSVQFTITQHWLIRHQAIIWTNADPILWRPYAALGGDESISTPVRFRQFLGLYVNYSQKLKSYLLVILRIAFSKDLYLPAV